MLVHTDGLMTFPSSRYELLLIRNFVQPYFLFQTLANIATSDFLCESSEGYNAFYCISNFCIRCADIVIFELSYFQKIKISNLYTIPIHLVITNYQVEIIHKNIIEINSNSACFYKCINE